MKTSVRYLLSLCLAMFICISASGQDILTIKSNYSEILIPQDIKSDTLLSDLVNIEKESIVSDQMIQELNNRYPFDIEQIENYLKLINPDGSFADINYQDTKRSGWDPKRHGERLLELCQLYASPTTPYQHSAKIMNAVHTLMNYWFTTKPVCKNWWYNQIGVPKTMGQSFLIIENELTPDEKKGALAVMNNAKFGMTGQNKVWLASNVLIKALLLNDEALVKAARDTIVSEISVDNKEGIKPDWSYQLHGPQLQFGNYGLAYLNSMVLFYKLFRNTSLQLSDEQVGILSNLVNQGFRWTIWHRYMDINSLGRQLFHNGDLHKGYCLALAAQDLGINGFPLHSNPLIGHKHFPYSDYTIHRTHDWMMSLKMSSSRTIGSEHVNEDNVLGYYLGDGAAYYYVDNSSCYLNAMPVWDWRKVPGTTAYESSQAIKFSGRSPQNKSSQVGGISEGFYGVSAMNYDKDGIKARKSWFFTPDFVACLGSGISSDSSLVVTSSVDQRLAKGKLLSLNHGKWTEIKTGQTSVLDGRLWHDNMGYIIQGNEPAIVKKEKKTGSWSANMEMYPYKEVEDTLVNIYFSHGTQPRNKTYAYIVLPNCSASKVKVFNANLVTIIKNEPTIQMVGGSAFGHQVWAVVYKEQIVKYGRANINFKSPGLYQLEKSKNKYQITKFCDFNNLK